MMNTYIGFLLILWSFLSWQPENEPVGISFPWKLISVHGITPVPTKSIYLLFDEGIYWHGKYNSTSEEGNWRSVPEHYNDEVSSDNEDDTENKEPPNGGGLSPAMDDEQISTEIWLQPIDPNTVPTIYRAMCECQALNPEPETEMLFSDREGDENEEEYIEPYRVTPPYLYNYSPISDIECEMDCLNLDEDPQRFDDAIE